MSHARQRNVRRIGIFATAGGLVCAGAVVAGAFAGESSPAGQSTDAATLARTLGTQLGTDSTAGSWVGKDGKAVVAVTDPDTATAVQDAGATAQLVARSGDQLDSATAALRAAPTVTGTAWSVDPRTNQVVVLADSTVSSADWTSLSTTAAALDGAVRMERTAGIFSTRAAVNGGDAIFSDVARCSLGFNVTDGTSDFILTAGHCGAAGTPWSADQQSTLVLGSTTQSIFPGAGDFSLVATGGTEVEQPSEVDLGGGSVQAITTAAEAVVGETVTRSGSTTGVTDGQVTALNATVNYPEGTVTGLIQTTVCAEPGDSGGPLFDGDAAIGLTSGGDGDCTVGGTTFFQPVTTALAALGVQIPGADATASASASAAETATSTNRHPRRHG